MRTPGKDIIKIFDKLDNEGLGLLPHDDIVFALFPEVPRGSKRGGVMDERAESDVRVALRKRPDLLEELVTQLKSIESQHELVLFICFAARDNRINNILFCLLSITGGLLRTYRHCSARRTLTAPVLSERTISLCKYLLIHPLCQPFPLDLSFVLCGSVRSCLAKFGFKLVSGMERDLIDTLTSQSAQRVRYEDFIDALRADVKSDNLLDDVILRLRKHVSRDEKNGLDIEQVRVPLYCCIDFNSKMVVYVWRVFVMQVFTKIDRDGDGEVDVYEFEAALDKIGMQCFCL